MSWFTDPFYTSTKTVVRPAVASMRRKEVTVKVSAPMAAFKDILSGLEDGCTAGFKRTERQRLVPTRNSSNSFIYQYKFKKASVIQKLMTLERGDLTRGPTGKLPRGASKRGLGAARLHLSKASQARGRLAKLISMVCTATLTIIEPKRLVSMPRAVLNMTVLTMDQHGHITWPTNFDAAGKARLRKAVRRQLERMTADPLYPVDPLMAAALTQEGDSILDLDAVRQASAAQKAQQQAAKASRRAA